jgi:response regulator RpfG family c-di-GMP phosphodiesterase
MKKLLFIDDDENNLFAFKVNLKEFFKVYTTSNTDINFLSEIIIDNKIDIVISDELMPYINGSDLIKSLKKIFPKINYILTSAHIDELIVKNLKDNKIIDMFFEKPWNISTIIDNVKNIGVKYGRVALINKDELSVILNSTIIRNNIKNVIVYDFTDINKSVNFLCKHSVDLIIIDDTIINTHSDLIKICQKDTPIFVLTDNHKNDFLISCSEISDYIYSPILKSNTHIIEKAIYQTN